MKYFIGILLFWAAPGFAQTLSGQIDYLNLPDGSNAGTYQIEFALQTITGLVHYEFDEVHGHDDGSEICTVTVNYPIGTSTITITNETGRHTSESRKLNATLEVSAFGHECVSVEYAIDNAKRLTIELGSVEYKLPARAPHGDAYFNTLVNGPRLNLDLKGQRLTGQIDATQTLATALKQNQPLIGDSYLESVTANGHTRRSWGQGIFELK